MWTDIKLSTAKISKIISSGGSWLGNLGKKTLTQVAIPLARGDNLPGVVISLTCNKMEQTNLKEK